MILQNLRLKARLPRFRAQAGRGATLVEVVVSVGIFAFVSVFVAYLLLVSARMYKTYYGAQFAEMSARRAMEGVRRHAMEAMLNTVMVKDSGRTIEYTHMVPDPADTLKKVQVTASLKLVANKDVVYNKDGDTRKETVLQYTSDITGAKDSTALDYRGVSDVVFALQQDGTMLEARVSAAHFRAAARAYDFIQTTAYRADGTEISPKTNPYIREGTTLETVTLTDKFKLRN